MELIGGFTKLIPMNNKNIKPVFFGASIMLAFLICMQAVNDFRSYTPAMTMVVSNKVLNKWYQGSTQRDMVAAFSTTIGTSSTLVAGMTGQVVFETAIDTLSTVTQVMLCQSGLSAGLLNPGTSGSITVFGSAQRNVWFRIRTIQSVGTPSFTAMTGLEFYSN